MAAGVGLTVPAFAATAAPTIRTIASTTVEDGATTTIKPRYSASSRISVRSARLDVRRGSSWLARGRTSARVAAGTYGVTTKVKYRVRSGGTLGRLRTTTRSQTLVVSKTPTTTLAQAPARDACGTSPGVKADGTRWTCTFADEFTGSALDRTKWAPQVTASSGYRLGGDCFVDRPSNISVANGQLSLSTRKQAAPFTCASPDGSYSSQWTSGMVTTWSSFAQTTGRFEIRAAFPATKVPGHHSALWLFPKEPREGAFPASGEIDIAEMYSQWSDRVIPYVHYPSGPDFSVTNNYCMIADVSAFHTYTLTWTTSTMTIAYDGKPCVTHTINGLYPELGSAPFDKPFLMVLTQGLGLGENAATAQTPTVGTTKVDWVKAWK